MKDLLNDTHKCHKCNDEIYKLCNKCSDYNACKYCNIKICMLIL